jgi:hypothetical protein
MLAGKDFEENSEKLYQLYRLSVLNRMPLTFLELLKENRRLGELKTAFDKKSQEFSLTIEVMTDISHVLRDANVDYAFFKTVRPYRSTSVDIDTVIFGKTNYGRSVKALREAGYEVVVRGPQSTTMVGKASNIGIDIYEEIAVSFMVYMEKDELEEYVIPLTLPNDEEVYHLNAEADLATIIAHSVIKEQMYTLSEYYSFINYLEKMNIDNFLRIIGENRIKCAARVHASITALLHSVAYQTLPRQLHRVLTELGLEKLETTTIKQDDFKTPHKYHPITIARSLLEISMGKTSRNSMAIQIYQMAHPTFAATFIKALTEHVLRQTY